MNDRFKYRIFDKKTDMYLPNDDSGGITPNGKYIGIDVSFREPIDLPNDFIIEQCTELSDKNGNLIYEGDVIKGDKNLINPVDGVAYFTGVVARYETGGYFCKDISRMGFVIFDKKFWDACEIIGNIHQKDA